MLDQHARRRQHLRNWVHGFVLLATMLGALGVLATIVFGPDALFWVGVLGVGLAILRPRLPAGWMLAMYGAVPLSPHAAPELHQYLRVLAARAGLARAPALFYVPTRVANAFAVGTGGDAAVAVTDGLLRTLTSREVAAVLAHELAHVRAGDTTVMTLSDAIAQLIHALSWAAILGLVVAVPATAAGQPRVLVVTLVVASLPTIATLLQLALIRSREYDADVEGAALTGDPHGLISALETLERIEGPVWERMVSARRTPDPLLVRTHPPTAVRTERLRALVPRVQHRLGDARRVPLAAYPEAVRRRRSGS